MAYVLKMEIDDIRAMLAREFPQVDFIDTFHLDALRSGEVDIRLRPTDRHLRPGGTISGPSMMTLVDVAAYIVILAHLGPVALAVTTNLNINFLRKPGLEDMICRCKLLKLGKRLAVTEATLFSGDVDDPVAHATATYSIPPADRVL